MEKECKYCKVIFSTNDKRQKYCSLSCRQKVANHKFYNSHKEDYKNRWEKYYAQNKKFLLEKSKDRYYYLKENNPNILKYWNKNGSNKYRKTSKGKLSRVIGEHRRRSKIKDKIDKKAWLEKLKLLGGKCVYCGSSEKITIDHIIPICKGGTNEINNLQPLCLHCNSSKGGKLKDEEKVRHS